jgi:putative hydroxymethylpyrimidine transport system substrate-binding protein
VSGLPSDPAVLRAVVEGDGGDYEKIRQVTIGFAAVPNLIQKNIDAVPAFWNAEGVILRQRGASIREFRVDDYGAPPSRTWCSSQPARRCRSAGEWCRPSCAP